MALKQDTFENRLKESNVIVVCGYIDGDMASNVIFNLLAASAADDKEEIQLFISSTDGSYTDAMAIYDTLSTIPNPIVGVAVGAVSGYATLLLSRCTKGKRFALSHTEISFSQPYGVLSAGSNQQTEIAIEARETSLKRSVFESQLALTTGQSQERVHADCEVGVTLSAEQAKEYGIIDEVL